MEDNSDATLRPGFTFRAMNVRLPSARKLSIVLLATFALFAALASTSSFETITAFATSAIKLITFALKFLPSSGKVPIQISNVTFNYMASPADGGNITIDLPTWVHGIILTVARWLDHLLMALAQVLVLHLIISTILRGEAEKMKALERVAYPAPIDAPGHGADGMLLDKRSWTRVSRFETPYSTTIYTTVETAEFREKTQRPVARRALAYLLPLYPPPNQPKTSTIRFTIQAMPDQNPPDNTRAARHAAEKRSWIIKIYCIIAFFDLGIFGLFPNWWAANSLAVVTALLYLGVRYLANIDAAAQEDDGDDAIELREGVGHSMVSEYMAGDGEARDDDGEGLEDGGGDDDNINNKDNNDGNNDGNNNTDNDGNNNKDDRKDEHKEEKQEADDEDRKKAESKDIQNIDTCHIYGTRTNIYVTQGGSMHIHVAPGGTFNVNVHEDAAVMEADREE
ncbi:uncharacterized protein J4E79_009389 [Alternaria viburni]|uniref:uncharacterized protein n=1 Tax=Alternaria viburni TaxID=566460 RepID=UPI0020C27FF3|nr:uncharacterized protein J4E79_009389 [Alternaria viburni]KAI4651190.1 hypothetical protein J4E79_009389 [Alternaria viburni]